MKGRKVLYSSSVQVVSLEDYWRALSTTLLSFKNSGLFHKSEYLYILDKVNP